MYRATYAYAILRLLKIILLFKPVELPTILDRFREVVNTTNTSVGVCDVDYL